MVPNPPSITSSLAAALALAGLAVAVISGLIGDLPVATILERALFACGGCFALGLGIGVLLDGVVRRHAQDLRDQAMQLELDAQEGLDHEDAESEGLSSAMAGERIQAV